MHLTTRNINTAFRELVTLFHTGVIRPGEIGRVLIVRKSSRNGPVIMIEEPVTITYGFPRERILFNTARDCNPFSLLYESLWMLAGRNDVAPLAYYTKNFANYSDDGKTLSGAYGYRWRWHNLRDRVRSFKDGLEHSVRLDQLDAIVEHLKVLPESRRAVLQMWDIEQDLLRVGGVNTPTTVPDGNNETVHREVFQYDTSKDICCNLSVLFSIRETKESEEGVAVVGSITSGRDKGAPVYGSAYYLDITVTNRSNDLVWGLLNANYCCFSVLQEYMAARLGVEVGVYNHFSNNLHVYESNWKPEEWLAYYDGMEVEYTAGMVKVPLVRDPTVFEKELPIFVERNSGGESYSPCSWREPFLNDVAQPLCTAFRAHKEKWITGPMIWVDQIKADDWRAAAAGWFARRKKNATVSTV